MSDISLGIGQEGRKAVLVYLPAGRVALLSHWAEFREWALTRTHFSIVDIEIYT